ncbi:hypothetical protein [Virgibacillus senegalensis]|uniref:hypothetical protein n=1 Tax=Virgibacillus senegalensis TaxID=1499679 RepID=UPI00069DEA2A|nr:hypothetical protein [Virgibacillus senegalensis]
MYKNIHEEPKSETNKEMRRTILPDILYFQSIKVRKEDKKGQVVRGSEGLRSGVYKNIHEEPKSETNKEMRRTIFTGYFELPINKSSKRG